MDIKTAREIIGAQNGRIRTLNGKRFTHKGYEYEIRFEGGFASFVGLYRREVGRRNFKYYKGTGCSDCFGATSAFEKLNKLLPQ